MKKLLVIIVAILSGMVSLAQSERDVYNSLRKTGLKSLDNHQYAKALVQFEGAKELYNTIEIQQDIKRVNDSITAAYNRAKRVYNTYGNNAKQRAIVMFSELLDVKTESYAYIGECYYLLGDTILARDYFEKGIVKNDALSAYWYALFLRKTKPKSSISQRILLYKKVTTYVGVTDSLGIEYESLNKVDSAYFWYSKSTSILSKYNRASLLLDTANNNELKGITEDPLKLLEEVANNTNDSNKTIRAQAAYYLGMLYRYRSKVKGDNNNICGWQWIERAANMGHIEAKRILKNKNEYEK